MKKALILSFCLSLLAVSGNVQAAPTKAAENNPQVVAYYPTGPHGIPGESEYHEGMDIVKKNGNSGNFQQWFYGTSASEGLIGHHTVWKVAKEDGCKEGETLVPMANPAWGDYLVPNVDYCTKTNDYLPSK